MAKKQTEPNLFTFLKQIQGKSKKYPYDKKIAPAFMLTHWLAHDPYLIDIVNELNKLQFYIPDEVIYQYYFDRVPKNKRFLKWIKKSPQDKKREKSIEELKIQYNISTNEAKVLMKHVEKVQDNIF